MKAVTNHTVLQTCLPALTASEGSLSEITDTSASAANMDWLDNLISNVTFNFAADDMLHFDAWWYVIESAMILDCQRNFFQKARKHTRVLK